MTHFNAALAVAFAPEELTNQQGLEVRAKQAILKDLQTQGWRVEGAPGQSVVLTPPAEHSKDAIRRALLAARLPLVLENLEWIRHHEPRMRRLMAPGYLVDPERIRPSLELCTTESQRDVFRYFRFYWSSPFSEYVGRRMRFLVRDESLPNRPIIGLFALGSSIIHIPARDRWLGWDVRTRTERIGYMMDVYALGALPPYNLLLGGKLISLLAASNEVRDMYRRRYQGHLTLGRNREITDLVLLVTTSLYGRHSSQYNRVRFEGKDLYHFIGLTSGYGTMHISPTTFALMRELLDRHGIKPGNRFGDGPNWRIRVIRNACELVGLDPEIILQHSYQRGIYAVPLADNFRPFLLGQTDTPQYRDLPMARLVEYWRRRWLIPRFQRPEIRTAVNDFRPEAFTLLPQTVDGEPSF